MVVREKNKSQEKNKRNERLERPHRVPDVLRRIVLAALPSAMLLGPVALEGCICPTYDKVRSFLLPHGEIPKSHEECIALCRREIGRFAEAQRHMSGEASRPYACDAVGLTEITNEGLMHRGAIRCAYKVTRRCIGGRLPAGALAVEETEDVFADVGAYFAQLCYLERAAVEAFRQLHDELVLHGAPESLVKRAGQAILEEQQHAETTGVLAQAWGGEIRPLVMTDVEPRSLLALAYDNAVEGCVRESFAPLTAHWQALHAPHASIRAAMQRIAEDEAGHAALSWDIEAWLMPKLSLAEQAEMRCLREKTIGDLEKELQKEPAACLIEQAGLPDASVALELLQQAKRHMWRV
ncbi:MAG: hypothetical protein H6727_18145 [Myxococcales bacterium]|nr:hypothetical protein [Myxococcales bacterium]